MHALVSGDASVCGAAGHDRRNCAAKVLTTAITDRVIRGPRIARGGADAFWTRVREPVDRRAGEWYEPEACSSGASQAGMPDISAGAADGQVKLTHYRSVV